MKVGNYEFITSSELEAIRHTMVKHHSATCQGYMLRKVPMGYITGMGVQDYSGRFGTGKAVFTSLPWSTRLVKVTYYINPDDPKLLGGVYFDQCDVPHLKE